MRIVIIFLMDDDQTRALVAGTLALMTHYVETGCPAGAERIRQNLLHLSAARHLPWEFRAALAKLGARRSLLETGLKPVVERAGALH
jgi:hypothetical protein